MNGFVSAKKNLILANATPPLQAAHNATDSIPVLGTSITDYGAALDMTIKDGKTGINVSGTSDLAPLDKQAELFKTLLLMISLQYVQVQFQTVMHFTSQLITQLLLTQRLSIL